MASDPNALRATGTVDLAHEASFFLGDVEVRPALRQLFRRDDGRHEVVEPRIMQVLVALAQAGGDIVTRDELTRRCWQGRVVGEDAINRTISRVRRLSQGIGRDCFGIETVNKVGYRLLRSGDAGDEREPASAVPVDGEAPDPPDRFELDRRLWIGGAVALAGAAAGGLLLGRFPAIGGARDGDRTRIAALMNQAQQALRQDTREGQNQSFGIYRRLTALHPGYADGWGALGMAYAATAPFRDSAEGATLRGRALEAARRALAIDGENARARATLALVRPRLGGWLHADRELRRAVAERPDDPLLLLALAAAAMAVGRAGEAVSLHARAAAVTINPTPGFYFARIMALQAADRIDETDRLAAEAAAIFPTHYAIWFARFFLLLHSGRAGAAIAFGENRDERPSDMPAEEFESVLRVARAMRSGDAATVDATVREQVGRARRGAGYAENAMQFTAALRRPDEAFRIADAYFFGRGFVVPEIRFRAEQGAYTPPRERQTACLFLPATAAMRADPRFGGLMREIGLADFWRTSGLPPDYARR